MKHTYQPGDKFYEHHWRKLNIDDVIRVEKKRGRIKLMAKVIEVCGIDKYKLEVVERYND
jgi:hypothetical protein